MIFPQVIVFSLGSYISREQRLTQMHNRRKRTVYLKKNFIEV